MTSPYLERPLRALDEVLAGYRTEAAMLFAFDPRLAWLLATISLIEAELASRGRPEIP